MKWFFVISRWFLFLIGLLLLFATLGARLSFVHGDSLQYDLSSDWPSGVLLLAAVVFLSFSLLPVGPPESRRTKLFGVLLVVCVAGLATWYSYKRYAYSQERIENLESYFRAKDPRGLRDQLDLQANKDQERSVEKASWWVSSARRQALLDKILNERRNYEQSRQRQ